MKQHFNKFLYGNLNQKDLKATEVLTHSKKILDVWNSSYYHDFGIERIFRLFLVTSKLFFPGVYIDFLSRNFSYHQKKITAEVYVIFKTILPFVVLYYNLWHNPYLFMINIYLLIETFLYIFYKIFLPEHSLEKTHNRSLILLFFNFLEVIASFAVIYAAGNYLNHPINDGIEALYFSFITGATIGYGDYHPITESGKILVIMQIITTLTFLILFFNFFVPRVQDKGNKD